MEERYLSQDKNIEEYTENEQALKRKFLFWKPPNHCLFVCLFVFIAIIIKISAELYSSLSQQKGTKKWGKDGTVELRNELYHQSGGSSDPERLPAPAWV